MDHEISPGIGFEMQQKALIIYIHLLLPSKDMRNYHRQRPRPMPIVIPLIDGLAPQ